MTYNKLVIRRLPPSMSEDEFINQVGPLADHDYFCFFEASSGLGCHAYSRAYINFIQEEDMRTFLRKFDNHKFIDKNGREFVAVVEQSLWHKSATSGPFSVQSNRCLEDDQTKKSTTSQIVDKQESLIEQDPDYLDFVERVSNQKRNSQQSPIHTIENNLDELTNASGINTPSKDGKTKKVSTPLLEYVNQVRIMKNNKRSR